MVTVVRRFGAAGAVALVALIATRAAMLPGIDFWDTAELQTVGPLLGTAHSPGFPTYVLLGWLASVVLQPFGEPAFRMNLLAGLCVAAAVGITVDLVRALARSTLAGILAGLGLAFTPIVWAIGTRADVHALHLLFVAAILRLLVAWQSRVDAGQPTGANRWLVAAAVVFGLSVGNHSLTLLLVPPIALFVLLVDREAWRNRRLVASCAIACLVALVLVYLELPLRAGPFRAAQVYGQPETWAGFWYVVLGAQFLGSVVNPFSGVAGSGGNPVDRIVQAFGILAPLVPIGFVVTWRVNRSYAVLTGVAALITCLFAGSYVNADIGRYYLGPALVAWTWIGILAAYLARAAADVLGRAIGDHPLPTDRPRQAFAAAVLVALIAPTVLSLADRFALVDERQDRDAAAWVDHALAVMPPGAVLVSWWSYSTPLWYAQRVEGRRPDLSIIDDRTRLDENLGGLTDVIDAHLGRDPVFVIREDPREALLLAERYRLEPIDGVDALGLTRVLGLRVAGS